MFTNIARVACLSTAVSPACPADNFNEIKRAAGEVLPHRPDIVLATGNNINWFAALGVISAKTHARYYIKTTNPIVRQSDGAVAGRLRRAVYGLIFRRAAGVLISIRAKMV